MSMDPKNNSTKPQQPTKTPAKGAAPLAGNQGPDHNQEGLVPQDEPLKNNDRDVNGDPHESWNHRNGAAE